MYKSLRASFCALLAFAVMTVSMNPANAWGGSGHRIVAMIAQKHLTSKAKQKIAQILGPNVTLASVATFADDIRNSQPSTKNFHFVDIQKDETDYVPSRDCPQTAKGDCVIAALERFKAQLLDSHTSKAKKQFALKFIVHLVGDMHQPLHCADNHDRGGNDVNVRFFNRQTNLHAAWDSSIISRVGQSDSAYANRLNQGLSDAEIAQIQQGSIIDWALQSHTLARTNAYDIPDNHKLGQEYFNTNKQVVDDQLRKGGLRLAKVLNDLFR